MTFSISIMSLRQGLERCATGLPIQGDGLIDLSSIDASTTHAGNDAFHFIGASPFSGNAGALHQFSLGAKTIIEGDVNGDGHADFQIALLSTNLAPMEGDFVL